MNIGIIVYSQTGNTYAVAEIIKNELEAAGHVTNIERVTITGDPQGSFQLVNIPDAASYDALIFGSPVHAFSLARAMAEYLKQLPALQNKKTACFVTKHLPFGWTGGNRAITAMENICSEKGAKACESQIVIWAKSKREQSIRRCVKNISSLF